MINFQRISLASLEIYHIMAAMKLITDAELLAAIDDFLRRHPNVSTTRFGLATMRDGALVEQLRGGRSLSLRNANKVAVWMEDFEKPVHCDRCSAGCAGEVAACTDAACEIRPQEAAAA